LRAAIKGLDLILRLCYGIREYSRDPDCILRLGFSRSRRDLVLADGTRVTKGELVGDLHLWNERLPVMPPGGPGLRWAVEFQRKARRSLELLADLLEGGADGGPGGPAAAPPDLGLVRLLGQVRAFRAVGSLMSREPSGREGPGRGERPGGGPASLIAAVPAVAARLGLEIVDVEDPSRMSPARRFAAFWENGFNLALVWAYNPPSLRSRSLPRLRRVQLWISRARLLGSYGRAAREEVRRPTAG